MELLIPPAKPGGRPRAQNMREILNAIFYVLRAGWAWRLLPHELSTWSTVYGYFCLWRLMGLLEQINTCLREAVRLQAGSQYGTTGSRSRRRRLRCESLSKTQPRATCERSRS